MLRKKLSKITLVFLLTFCSSTLLASGKVYINVGDAKIKKSLLALPPFQFYGSSADSNSLSLGKTLFQTISNDLKVSNYFTFIKQGAFLEDTSKVGLKPAPGAPNGFDFKKWKTIGTEFLIRGGYKVTNGNLNLEVYVYYIPQAKLIFGKTYEGPASAVRKIAHTFADDVVDKLTGKKGMFNTKIVALSNYGGLKNNAVYIMDWDGANKKKVSNTNTIHISPTWSHDAEKIAYTAYAYHPKAKTRNADLFMYELTTGKRWLVSYRKGINSGASFSPDGRYVYLTISQGGNPDIFRMTKDGKRLVRITNGPSGAMNVEPAVSPDGKKIAFSSDRSGRPMIYIMDIDGSNVKRITRAGTYNASPTWSPDGQTLVFAGNDKGHFDLFSVSVNGTNLKRLTSARKKNGKWADNENPSFSPDGRQIVFSSNRTGNYQLYIISPDGRHERRITFDNYNYKMPKWSTFLE